MNDREPLPLRDALVEVGRALGLPSLGTFDVVVDTWSQVAGPDLARHTRVRSLRERECVVEVDEPAFATRARYLEPELVRRVNERCGGVVVTAVSVVVRGPRKAV